jgi:hypothetical protein
MAGLGVEPIFKNMDLLQFLNMAIVFFQGHMQEEFHKTFTRVQLKNRWTWVFLEIFFQGHIREDYCKLQDFHRRSCSWNETSMSYPSLSRLGMRGFIALRFCLFDVKWRDTRGCSSNNFASCGGFIGQRCWILETMWMVVVASSVPQAIRRSYKYLHVSRKSHQHPQTSK